ncbi:c-type cytochrome [Massilia timonae]|uniref:c-type cytochrome n=1 Tax=Massilia timonae TaxID=47229 RepID=UPI0023568205|nr:c-type cytochrome [Massilia timonae]
MNKNDPGKRPAAPQVDEAFDPWERTRPVPLFVVALVFALAFWGLLTYVSEYQAQRRALQVKQQQAGAPAAVRAALAPPAAARGLGEADAATLQIVAAGKGQAWSCASCHGAAGEGSLSTPRLAGQPAAYLAKQLEDFRSGLRHNESMAFVARALTDQDIEKLARYYAGIELRAALAPSLGGNLERGRLIAEKGDWKSNVPACFSCHGMNGEGVAPGFPALAGQQPDYIFAQLAAWHAGERKNSPQKLMDDIARRMNPDDMRAVADYLGSMPSAASPAATPPATVAQGAARSASTL